MKKIKFTFNLLTITTLVGCSSGNDDPTPAPNELSCGVEENKDGTATIECPDGSSVTINPGHDGASGQDGQEGKDGKSGEPGAEGKDGKNGENGAPGEAGEDGENGTPGQDGENGAPGQDGTPGQDGAPGQNGLEGEPGADGTPGQDGQDGEDGAPGEAGTSCSVECVDDQTVRMFCEDGNEVRYQVESCKMPPESLLSARGTNGCWILPADRRLACWGADENQALGNGPYEGNQKSANLVDTRQLKHGLDTRWRFVDSSQYASCGITLAGEAYCWSRFDRMLGNGGVPSFVPSAVDLSALPLGTTWSVISAGNSNAFSCGITALGAAYCWGTDSSGKLGNGSVNTPQLIPSAVDVSALPPETTWTTIGAGNLHACGLTAAGEIYCWGFDSSGRLGNGSTLTATQVAPSAVDLSGLSPGIMWTKLSVGRDHTCALTSAGKPYCWGNDANGQLGNGALGEASQPSLIDTTALPQGVTLTQLSAGDQHTCGLASDGSAWCWGNRSAGRLGDGNLEGIAQSPVLVDTSRLPEGATWKSLSAGVDSTCGLTRNDEVFCWGNDEEGQLGNGAALSGPQLRPEHALKASIGVLPGYPAFSGAVEGHNAHKELIVLPLHASTENLSVTATSSDQAIIPNANITVLGTGSERQLALQPIASGLVTITVVVADNVEEVSLSFEYGASAIPADPASIYHHHISDASTALDVGDGYVLLGDDQTNSLFLYEQGASGRPLKVWDFTKSDQLGTSTIGVEAVARSGDTIVWATSHANSFADGSAETRRRVIFSTKVSGSGADVELSFTGRYGSSDASGLRGDLISWDMANGHGLGAHALEFEAKAATGVMPTAPGGFNIEGLEFAADAATGYLAFRAPTINVSGIQHALIVPVRNLLDLVDGMGEQSGRGQFGAPILLDLGGRSIRDLRRTPDGQYLIVASPPSDATVGVNDTWALYSWAGVGQPAVFNRELPDPSATTGGDWEGITSVPNSLHDGAGVRLVTDSGSTVFYGTGTTSDLGLGLRKSYSQVFLLN